MVSITELLYTWADSILEDVTRLLSDHSDISRWNEPGSSIFLVGGDYKWADLDLKGRQRQSKVVEEFHRFAALLHVLLRAQPRKQSEQVDDAEEILLKLIEQDDFTWLETTADAVDKAREALDVFKEAVSSLYGESTDVVQVVPDTNSLLFNPQLEDWAFRDFEQFRLVLTPTVVSELDELKMLHRVESVRRKAKGLINRIKEYRRRGSLTDGVPLVRGRSEVVALAVEPRMADSLPWLDPANNDDRIVASVLEVMRTNPRSAVTLITRDLNLQNKAEFSRIPYGEPPET